MAEDKHLIEWQPDTRIREDLHYDATDDMCTSVRTQDAEWIVERAKRFREIAPKHHNDAYTFAGTVPAVVMDKAIREGWANDGAAWIRYLNENPAFKTTNGPIDPKRD
jgi:hypothetical protein